MNFPMNFASLNIHSASLLPLITHGSLSSSLLLLSSSLEPKTWLFVKSFPHRLLHPVDQMHILYNHFFASSAHPVLFCFLILVFFLFFTSCVKLTWCWSAFQYTLNQHISLKVNNSTGYAGATKKRKKRRHWWFQYSKTGTALNSRKRKIEVMHASFVRRDNEPMDMIWATTVSGR